MRKSIAVACLIVALMSAGISFARPVTYELPPDASMLRPGPGLETAQGNCTACHSADYLAMQPPKRGKTFWEAEIGKMIKTYKAPISDDDAKVIVDYLTATY